eukprot:Skav225818  [mRNA]  locus=scaffold3383:27144:27359:- [translate_table: standard]
MGGWSGQLRGQDTWGFLRSDAVPGDIFVGLRENPHLGPAGGLSEGTAVLFDVRKARLEGCDGATMGIHHEG